MSRVSFAQRRRALEARIRQERAEIGQAVHEWEVATARVDNTASKVMAYRKPIMAISGFLLLRRIKKSPSRLFKLGQRGVALYALARNATGVLKRLRGRK